MDTQDNVLNAKSNHIFCWPFKFDEHRWDEVTSHLLKSGSGADSRWSEKSMEYTDYAEKRQKSRTEKGEQIQVSQTERCFPAETVSEYVGEKYFHEKRVRQGRFSVVQGLSV